MTDLLPIGEVARRSGLTVSALRFYDGAGVLSPQAVDATSGYRRYAPGQVAVARLVAGLRRVGAVGRLSGRAQRPSGRRRCGRCGCG